MDIKELIAKLAEFDEMEAPDGMNICESNEDVKEMKQLLSLLDGYREHLCMWKDDEPENSEQADKIIDALDIVVASIKNLDETSDKRAEKVEDKRFKKAEKAFKKEENGEELTDEDKKAIDKFEKNADLMDRRAVRRGELSPFKAGVKTAFKGREEELEKLRKEYEEQ